MESSKADALHKEHSHQSLPWWLPDIDHRITPELRGILHNYSHVPPENVKNHIYEIREKAWHLRPYPCTGLGTFLNPMISYLPNYAHILDCIKGGGSVVDVGCYAGTDLRQLVFDGCPQDRLYGTDIVNHWSLGYELFRDEERLKVKFIQSDILNLVGSIACLRGQMDVVSGMHLLHNWDWNTQVLACTNLIILSRSRPGSLVIGFQVGTSDPAQADWSGPTEEGRMRFHTPHSFQNLWNEVCKKTDTRWKVDVSLRGWEEFGQSKHETTWLGDKAEVLQFILTRTA